MSINRLKLNTLFTIKKTLEFSDFFIIMNNMEILIHVLQVIIYGS